MGAETGGWAGGAVLATGGAGFVGANLADRLAGCRVRTIVHDSLVRPGVARNLDRLKSRRPELIDAREADVRDADALGAAVRGAATAYHLAAQGAVTTSLLKPADDVAVNCAATVSLLEAARRARRPPRVVFTSTDKVYGALADVPVYAVGTRREPFDPDLRPTASASGGRRSSRAPTAAPRARPTGTCWTTGGPTASRPPCCR